MIFKYVAKLFGSTIAMLVCLASLLTIVSILVCFSAGMDRLEQWMKKVVLDELILVCKDAGYGWLS